MWALMTMWKLTMAPRMTYASIVNDGKPHMVETMESRVIKNKDRRSNRPLHGTAHDENGITLHVNVQPAHSVWDGF